MKERILIHLHAMEYVIVAMKLRWQLQLQEFDWIDDSFIIVLFDFADKYWQGSSVSFQPQVEPPECIVGTSVSA